MKKLFNKRNVIFLCLCTFMLILLMVFIVSQIMQDGITVIILSVLSPLYILQFLGHIELSDGGEFIATVLFLINDLIVLLTILFMYLGIYKKRSFSIGVYVIFGLDLIARFAMLPRSSFIVPIILDIIIITVFTIAMIKGAADTSEETPGFVLRGEWQKL